MRRPLLTLTQDIAGVGTPDAVHVKVKLSLTMTAVSGIGAIVGGSAINQQTPKKKTKRAR